MGILLIKRAEILSQFSSNTRVVTLCLFSVKQNSSALDLCHINKVDHHISMALTWPGALHGYTGSPQPDQCLVTFHSIKITQMLQCFQPELWKSTHQPCRQPLAGYFHSPFRGLSPAVMWPVVRFDMEAAPRSHQMKQSRTVCHWRVLITAWPLGFQLLRNQAVFRHGHGDVFSHTTEVVTYMGQ